MQKTTKPSNILIYSRALLTAILSWSAARDIVSSCSFLAFTCSEGCQPHVVASRLPLLLGIYLKLITVLNYLIS